MENEVYLWQFHRSPYILVFAVAEKYGEIFMTPEIKGSVGYLMFDSLHIFSPTTLSVLPSRFSPAQTSSRTPTFTKTRPNARI